MFFKRKPRVVVHTNVITRYVERPQAADMMATDTVVEQLTLVYAKALRTSNELYTWRERYGVGETEYVRLSAQMWLCEQQMDAAIEAVINLTGMDRSVATFQIPKRAHIMLDAGQVPEPRGMHKPVPTIV